MVLKYSWLSNTDSRIGTRNEYRRINQSPRMAAVGIGSVVHDLYVGRVFHWSEARSTTR
ncbi:hypothetical protein VCR9J2_720315 [Vibrio crassostreae]|nr:hypothetical protein VCR9J2_720315 [Vibrio crassostreae]